MSDIKVELRMGKVIDDDFIANHLSDINNLKIYDLELMNENKEIQSEVCILTNIIPFIEKGKYIGDIVDGLINQGVKHIIMLCEFAKNNTINDELVKQLTYFGRKVNVIKYFNKNKIHTSSIERPEDYPFIYVSTEITRPVRWANKINSLRHLDIPKDMIDNFDYISELIKSHYNKNSGAIEYFGKILGYTYNINYGYYKIDITGKFSRFVKYKIDESIHHGHYIMSV